MCDDLLSPSPLDELGVQSDEFEGEHVIEGLVLSSDEQTTGGPDAANNVAANAQGQPIFIKLVRFKSIRNSSF